MSNTAEKIENPFVEFFSTLVRNRSALIGLVTIGISVFVAIFAPWIAPHDPTEIFEGQYLVPPFWMEGSSSKFFLGTDDLGRDLFSRLLYGARISVGLGFLVTVCSMIVGTLIGLFAGYKGGAVDFVVMRVMDVIMSLPSILLAIVVVAILGPSMLNAVIAVSLVKIPAFVRLVRASVLVEKEKDHVVASASFGAGGFRQIFLNIFPNCTAPLIIQSTLAFSDGILDIAGSGLFGFRCAAANSGMGHHARKRQKFFYECALVCHASRTLYLGCCSWV